MRKRKAKKRVEPALTYNVQAVKNPMVVFTQRGDWLTFDKSGKITSITPKDSAK